MIEQLPNHQQAFLTNRYPELSERPDDPGGHMAYHRLLLAHPESGESIFIKAHDPSLLGEEWRQAEMLAFLKKEVRVYEHLRGHQFSRIPEHIEFNENLLALSGMSVSNGWYWRAPADKLMKAHYVQDVLTALDELEPLKPHTPEAGDEISLDIFYDNGWDILHNTDVDKLIETNIARWGKDLHPETAPLARSLVANISDLSLKRAGVVPTAFNHHDARQTNIAWHPEHGAKIVDWSWADAGLGGGDKTMFLLDLHKSDIDVTPYIGHINIDYAKLVLGYWLARSNTQHMEGNHQVRMQQFISAVKASELLAQL